MEVDTLPAGDLKHSNQEFSDIDLDSEPSSEQHQALVSNLSRSQGSAMYTFGDNIVQCSLFGPIQVSSNVNLLKKNYFHVYLYPLGKIRNQTKGLSGVLADLAGPGTNKMFVF